MAEDKLCELGFGDAEGGASVEIVSERDLPELLPLMRGYCDFYDVNPSDERLLALARTLIADPQCHGEQLIARQSDGAAVGFATLYWSFSTAQATPIGTMNDLFVVPAARGRRVGERLIEACRRRCAAHGAAAMEWQTAPANVSGQALYDRVGARREQWLTYVLEIAPR